MMRLWPSPSGKDCDPRLAPLLVMICCVMTGSGLVSPILSLYARTFGVAGALVGALVTVFGVGRLVANLPAGYLSQRIGRRPLLSAGPLIVAASSAGAALADSFSALLVWRFVQGLGSGLYITASLAALADISPPARRAGNVALYQAALQLGASIGPAVGGFVAQWFGYAAPFWAYMLVGLAAAATAFVSFKDAERVEAKPTPSQAFRGRLMTAPFMGVCALTLVAFFVRVVTLFQLIPELGAERFDLDVGAIGAALTLSAFMNFLVLPASAPLNERFGSRAVSAGATLGMAAGVFLLFALTSVAGFWLAVLTLGVTSGLVYPALSSFTIGCLPRERYGPGLGMQRTFGDIGFVFGPVVVGVLDDLAPSGGHLAGGVTCVVLLALGATLFLVGSRRGA